MSARYKGHSGGRERETGGFTAARRLFSLVVALLLLFACFAVMYPQILSPKLKEAAEEKWQQFCDDENVQLEEGVLGLENFPMYGSHGEYVEITKEAEEPTEEPVSTGSIFDIDPVQGTETADAEKQEAQKETVYKNMGFYGVKNVLEESKSYIKGDTDTKPDVGGLLKKITKNEGFLQALYSLVLISLISIPVYMILRLLIYNAIYDWTNDGFFLWSLPLRGVATLACGVTSACVSWVFYNTVLFGKLLKAVMNWLSGINAAKVAETATALPSLWAVNTTNIFAIVIVISAIIALVRITVFRGKIGISVALGLFRSLIFMVAFAFIEVFIPDMTWRVVLFGAIFVVAAGLFERIFDR